MSLRMLRLMAGLTQEDLARKLNVNHTAVSNWEKGKNKPCKKYHSLMASALNVSVEELRKELE